MRIAILMSTYNGHKYLDKQLKSIAEQTLIKNVTLYIRDDGSTDDTYGIISKWKSEIPIVLYKEKNAGPAMSFWNLLKKTEISADYYAFCDQDDIWDNDKLEVGIKHLHDDTHFYACNCRIIDDTDKIVRSRRLNYQPDICMQKLFVSGCTQGCSMIFTDSLRRHVLSCNISCVPMHDIILMLYALDFGKIFWDENPRFSYRVHSNNVVAKSNKTGIQKIKTTLWNWKNSSKNSMSKVAQELLDNCLDMSEKNKKFLLDVAVYKNSIAIKYRLISSKIISDMNNKELRSFKARIILNLY